MYLVQGFCIECQSSFPFEGALLKSDGGETTRERQGNDKGTTRERLLQHCSCTRTCEDNGQFTIVLRARGQSSESCIGIEGRNFEGRKRKCAQIPLLSPIGLQICWIVDDSRAPLTTHDLVSLFEWFKVGEL
jgi:hypothetical protein